MRDFLITFIGCTLWVLVVLVGVCNAMLIALPIAFAIKYEMFSVLWLLLILPVTVTAFVYLFKLAFEFWVLYCD